MSSPIDDTRAEMARFRAKLPELLELIPGRWVIFKDGEVQADFMTQQEAYDAAVARFGAGGGFIVVPIATEEPKALSPLYIYRMA